MKITKLKIAILATLLVPIGAFAHYNNQVEVQEVVEKVETPQVTEVEQEHEVIEQEPSIAPKPTQPIIQPQIESPAPEPLVEQPQYKTVREIATSMGLGDTTSVVFDAKILCIEAMHNRAALWSTPEQQNEIVRMLMVSDVISRAREAYSINCYHFIQ